AAANRDAARRVGGVTVRGRVPPEELARVVGAARVLLVPGVREGWGRVVLEANALGTPAVAYDVHGLRDAVVDGVTGRLTPRDPGAMAEAAVDLLGGPWRGMGDAARKHAASFGWEASVDAFEEVLRRAVA
ncbi:MAG TPA: glycosyltransferase, partial [Candidatus Thermoplasmatota archaeon]|nr:glycosyltransferase [Candidatus Thermoplasmatota archaeon]